MNPELIIFGGAFDPPHAGHIGCVQVVAERFPNAEIWITPAAIPAGAGGQHKAPSATFRQRLHMCEIAVNATFSDNPKVRVSDIEEKLPPPNFTIRTLTWIRATLPYRSIAIVVGADQMQKFSSWRAPVEILKTAQLVVVNRTPGPGDAKASVTSTLQALAIDALWDAEEGCFKLPELNSAIYILNPTLSPAASSVIREDLTERQELKPGWIRPEVLEYIHAENLYAPSTGDENSASKGVDS